MKLVREPLLHFLLAGALLFGAYTWLNRDEGDNSDLDHTIRITEREVAWLAENWARQWQRPPSDAELQGLVVDYLREELLAREARALELDRDDTVVRRRLAQKMTFILEDTSRLASPAEAQLRSLYDADPARFRTQPMSSFVQVYLSPVKRGERTAADARRTLERLRRHDGPVDPATFGDATMLPTELADADEQAIGTQFGADFARAVGEMKPGEWHGPIESGFGMHLVLVTARQEGRRQSFEEVRDVLLELWQREQEEAAKNAYFTGLLDRYDVQATESVQPVLGPAIAALKGTAK